MKIRRSSRAAAAASRVVCLSVAVEKALLLTSLCTGYNERVLDFGLFDVSGNIKALQRVHIHQ